MDYWVSLVLPDNLLLGWIVYFIMVVVVVSYLRVLCNALSWFTPPWTLFVSRVTILVMLFPCVVIYESDIWMAPAILVMALSVINQHAMHLLSSLFSLGLLGFLYMRYFRSRAEVHAYWFDLKSPDTILGRLLSAISRVFS